MSLPILYVNTRLVSGVAIPLPLQTAYLRDYCSKRGLRFSLPTAEYGFGNSYPALQAILRHKKTTALISTSLVLPSTASFDWSMFLKRAGCESRFHLVMERQICSLFELASYMIKTSLHTNILFYSAKQLESTSQAFSSLRHH